VHETNGWDVRPISIVNLVDSMGSDEDICDAARVSFDKSAENYSDEQNERLIRYLAKHDHWTPFAHVTLKFRFRALLLGSSSSIR
jgi:thymidylate synthase (FAD)